MIEQLERLDPFAAKQYPAYLKEVKRIYDIAKVNFSTGHFRHGKITQTLLY